MLHMSPSAVTATSGARDWRETIAVGDIIQRPLDGRWNSLGLVEVETIGGWPVVSVGRAIADQDQRVRPGTLQLTQLDEVRATRLIAPVCHLPLRCGQIAPAAHQHPEL